MAVDGQSKFIINAVATTTGTYGGSRMMVMMLAEMVVVAAVNVTS